MKIIAQIVRIASKSAFKRIKHDAPLVCNCLSDTILVTNMFYKHISWVSRKRKIQEIILRLSSIIIVPEILKKWTIIETRQNVLIEWKLCEESYKLGLRKKNAIFKAVISKYKWRLYLVSVFVNTEQMK